MECDREVDRMRPSWMGCARVVDGMRSDRPSAASARPEMRAEPMATRPAQAKPGVPRDYEVTRKMENKLFVNYWYAFQKAWSLKASRKTARYIRK